MTPRQFTYTSPFSIGDRVWIDGDRSLVAFVIGLQFDSNGVSIRCAWMHGGQSNGDLFDDWRLEPAE